MERGRGTQPGSEANKAGLAMACCSFAIMPGLVMACCMVAIICGMEDEILCVHNQEIVEQSIRQEASYSRVLRHHLLHLLHHGLKEQMKNNMLN